MRKFMRITILILLAIITVSTSSAAAEDEFIKVKTDTFMGYIIPKEYATQHLKGVFAKDGATFWTPTEAQVIIADAAFRNLIWGTKEKRLAALSNSSDAKYFEQGVPDIQRNFKSYSRKFIGIVVEGNEEIVCYYLIHGDASQLFPTATDQGTGFWGGNYNLNSKACLGLWMDGNG